MILMKDHPVPNNEPLLKIVFAADHAGFHAKQRLVNWCKKQRLCYQVFDAGTQTPQATDYPLMIKRAARLFRREQAHFAVLVCGTGIGVAMVANRYRFWRAYRFLTGDWAGLKAAREHNNANVLTLNGRDNHFRSHLKALKLFFQTPFSRAVRHHRRINQFSDPIA